MEDKLKIIRGDDASFTIQITDKDDLPVDITGCTIFFTAKRRKEDLDADAAIAESISEHVSATEGETRIVIPSTVTKDLKFGDYFWDLQIVYPDGKIQSCLYDILTVIPDITTRVDSSDELS